MPEGFQVNLLIVKSDANRLFVAPADEQARKWLEVWYPQVQMASMGIDKHFLDQPRTNTLLHQFAAELKDELDAWPRSQTGEPDEESPRDVSRRVRD